MHKATNEWRYEHRHFLRKQPPSLEALHFEEEFEQPPLAARWCMTYTIDCLIVVIVLVLILAPLWGWTR